MTSAASATQAPSLMSGTAVQAGTPAGPRMLTASQWEDVRAQALAAGLGDAELAGLAIGCPVHGNAVMDWDNGEVFCYLTH